MRVIIVGAVAAGMSAAAKLKRMKPEYFVSYQKIEKFKYDKQMLSILVKDTIVEKSEKDLTI